MIFALWKLVSDSCETWLTSDIRAAESVYMSSLKQLLGVRLTTCNDICLVEAGVGHAKSYIQERQTKFLHKLLNRENFDESYIGRIINLAIEVKCSSGKLLASLKNLGPQHDYNAKSLIAAKNNIRTSTSTRRITYLALNPQLALNEVYIGSHVIPEFSRISFTRIRTSSHRLRIETGRWTRTPREQRLCTCGDIQSEEHVLLNCPMSQELRSNFPSVQNYTSVVQLLNAGYPDIANLCGFCTKVLNLYA